MSLVSTGFMLFLIAGVVVYYLIPKKAQWAWLLIMSYAYYLCGGVKTVGFIIATTVITFVAGLLLEKAENNQQSALGKLKEASDKEAAKAEKKRIKEACKRKKKCIVLLALLADFGILAALKYYKFLIPSLTFSILLPLGISFYTFQSVSYIIDVYRNKYAANRNIFKFALFVSYFPQIMQGPIGRYDRLAPQFFAEHKYDLTVIQLGLQRMFWGLFKKFIIADRAAVVANAVFGTPENYFGMYTIIGVLCYCIQLYGDFSGGIDLVMGVSEMFGIKLDDNFRQPFFSKSIGEFWRRWHITLGTWMKDYVFYPFTLSKPIVSLGKKLKKNSKSDFGKYMAKALPICLADLLIFFIVGVWHGAAWKFIWYGMYNGIIIAVSSLLAPVYEKMFKLTHINKTARWYSCFQIARTFLLVNIGWYFDDAADMDGVFTMFKNTFKMTGISMNGILANFDIGTLDWALIFVGCVVWFIVSVLKEKGMDVRQSLSKKPLVIRWPVYLGLVLSVLVLGYINEKAGGFMYAQF